jgi:hypothetical protein
VCTGRGAGTVRVSGGSDMVARETQRSTGRGRSSGGLAPDASGGLGSLLEPHRTLGSARQVVASDASGNMAVLAC